MTRDQVLSVLVKIIAEQLGITEADVQLDKHFVRDLGADSLDLTELVMALEDEFGIEISNEQAERCHTVEDVLNHLMTYSDLHSHSALSNANFSNASAPQYVGARADVIVEEQNQATAKAVKSKREWVGLTLKDLPDEHYGNVDFGRGANWAEAKLKEKNT